MINEIAIPDFKEGHLHCQSSALWECSVGDVNSVKNKLAQINHFFKFV